MACQRVPTGAAAAQSIPAFAAGRHLRPGTSLMPPITHKLAHSARHGEGSGRIPPANRQFRWTALFGIAFVCTGRSVISGQGGAGLQAWQQGELPCVRMSWRWQRHSADVRPGTWPKAGQAGRYRTCRSRTISASSRTTSGRSSRRRILRANLRFPGCAWSITSRGRPGSPVSRSTRAASRSTTRSSSRTAR